MIDEHWQKRLDGGRGRVGGRTTSSIVLSIYLLHNRFIFSTKIFTYELKFYSLFVVFSLYSIKRKIFHSAFE